MKVIHEDCDPNLAKDKKLPYTAYIVEYMREGRIAYDIVNTTLSLIHISEPTRPY